MNEPRIKVYTKSTEVVGRFSDDDYYVQGIQNDDSFLEIDKHLLPDEASSGIKRTPGHFLITVAFIPEGKIK